MKKSSLLMLLVLPLLLVGCGKKSDKKPKDPFKVPVVDLDQLQVTLPQMETWDTTSAVKNDGEYDIIDIYQVSDMHAMIDFKTGTDGYWGFSGMANFLKQKRQDNKGTIVVSSGDMWQGGAESNLTRGKVVAECMRYVGFEAMALGNHEFDWGEDVLEHNSTYFTDDMPLLCGNLVNKTTGEMPTFVKASHVIERGGYKIGVIGTIGTGIEYSIAKQAFANFSITDSSTFASAEAARLKSEENCDIVVWCTHEDAKDTNAPANIDVLFGGHSHNNYSDEQEGPSVGHKVPRLQTKNYGDSIAHAQFKFDPSTKTVASVTGEYLRAQDNQTYLVDETNVKDLIDQYKAATSVVKAYQLNKVSGDFEATKQLANLSCKAMYESFKDESTFCALQNGVGGVRNDIKSGNVTYGDVYTSFPFDNEMVYFEIKGSEVRDFFDQGSIRGLNKFVSITKYAEFDSSKTYKIITTDFVCTNKLSMKETDFTRFPSTVIRDTVAEYIYNNNNLKADDFGSDKPNYQAPAKF